MSLDHRARHGGHRPRAVVVVDRFRRAQRAHEHVIVAITVVIEVRDLVVVVGPDRLDLGEAQRTGVEVVAQRTFGKAGQRHEEQIEIVVTVEITRLRLVGVARSTGDQVGSIRVRPGTIIRHQVVRAARRRALVGPEEVEVPVIVDVSELDIHLTGLERRQERCVLREVAYTIIAIQARPTRGRSTGVVGVIDDHIQIAIVVHITKGGRTRAEQRREATRLAFKVEVTRLCSTAVDVEVRQLRGEGVGVQRVDPTVTRQVACRDALGVRYVRTKACHGLIHKAPRGALRMLVHVEAALALRARGGKAITVSNEHI